MFEQSAHSEQTKSIKIRQRYGFSPEDPKVRRFANFVRSAHSDRRSIKSVLAFSEEGISGIPSEIGRNLPYFESRS